jgi:hypothetical protein
MTRSARLLALAAAASAVMLALSCGDSAELRSRALERHSAEVGVEPAGEAGAASEPTRNASYSVPVAEELEPWAIYPLARVLLSRDEARVRIRYGFPRWLGGVRQRIELEGAGASDGMPFDVTVGAFGTGSCTQVGSQFQCREFLPGITVDRAQAEARMQEDGLLLEEIAQRLKVTDAFLTDPIGIVAFELVANAP